MKDPDATDLDELVQEGISREQFRQLLDLVAQHSWWVSPQVYEKVPVVYPETRRKHTKEDRGAVDGAGSRLWSNEPAIEAFWRAYGKSPKQMKNYYVCHIYEESVRDPDHFTNLANLTAFPKSLQSLSEWRPVADVLKYHSFKMYGYTGPKGNEPSEPDYYPSLWQNQSDLSPERVSEVVRRLDEQRKSRPQFRKSEASTRSTIYRQPQQDRAKSKSYVKGRSCIKLGEKHEYENRGKYVKCTKCGSSRTIHLVSPSTDSGLEPQESNPDELKI